MAPPVIIDLTKDDQEPATTTVVDSAGRCQSSGTKRVLDVEAQFGQDAKKVKRARIRVPEPLPFDSPPKKPVKLILPPPLDDNLSKILPPLSDDSSDEDEPTFNSLRKIFMDSNDGDAGRESNCPMCNAPVNAEMLAEHSSNPSFETEAWLQRKFCTAHRTESAKQTWQERGYPSIDWGETLDSRLRRHDGLVRSLLSNSGSAAKESPFLRKFAEKVRSGRGRTRLQAIKSSSLMAPGYYGPRGGRHILEFVARTFHDEIRWAAVENRFVSVRGKWLFLESVVVPELAVRLIMEDMAVGRQAADRIMQDSSDVGELLNEDDDDVVVDDSDEDEDEHGGNLR